LISYCHTPREQIRAAFLGGKAASFAAASCTPIENPLRRQTKLIPILCEAQWN
jgi:hypothetical protein